VEFIRLERIHKTYERGVISVPVLKGISLSIRRREMVALMGASGSGKTTLINLLGFLDRPSSGRYILDGQDVTRLGEEERAWLRSRRIGFVFQSFNLLPRMTALENVMMPLAYRSHEFSERECRARSQALLERVGLGDRIDHEPARLSGGEQQRVAIARALANSPPVILADEPTAALDTERGESVMALFRQIAREKSSAVICVTHDQRMIEGFDHIYHVEDGCVFDGQQGAGAQT
jgi:macrolide transport system ATP-binding/permease protein